MGTESKSTSVSAKTFGKAWSEHFHTAHKNGASKNLQKDFASFSKNFVQANPGGPGAVFSNMDDAALDWGLKYNDNSIVNKAEYNSRYTRPVEGMRTLSRGWGMQLVLTGVVLGLERRMLVKYIRTQTMQVPRLIASHPTILMGTKSKGRGGQHT